MKISFWTKHCWKTKFGTRSGFPQKTCPLETQEVIPSMECIRMLHKDLKAYQAVLSLEEGDTQSTYTIEYPDLERTLEIQFSSAFPYTILGWKESLKSGYGENARTLVSQATRLETIKSPYWQRNGNEHLPLRDSLGL